MVVTVPLPSARRLTLGWTGATVWLQVWRERCVVPPDWDEPPGGTGVREPRRPIAPRWGGSVALPLDR